MDKENTDLFLKSIGPNITYANNVKTKFYPLQILLSKNKENKDSINVVINNIEKYEIEGNYIKTVKGKNPKLKYLILKIKSNDYKIVIDAINKYGYKLHSIIDTISNYYFIIKYDNNTISHVNMNKGKVKNLFYYLGYYLGLDYNIQADHNEGIPLPGTLISEVKNGSVKKKTVGYTLYGDTITYGEINKLIKINKLYKDSDAELLQMEMRFGSKLCRAINKRDFNEFIKLFNKKVSIDKEGIISINDRKIPGYSYNKKYKEFYYFGNEIYPYNKIPVGKHIIFIYNMLGQNDIKFISFIKGIDKIREIYETENAEKPVADIDLNDFGISITTKKVYLNLYGSKATTRILFRNTIKLIGQTEGYVFENGMQNGELTNMYILETDNGQKIVKQITTKNKFNNLYGQDLFFFGTDNDLGLFFHGLKKFGLDKYNLIQKNGIFGNNVIVGGKAVVGSIDDKTIIDGLEGINFGIADDLKQISTIEYLKYMQEIYKDEIALPVVLQTIALAGMNIRTGKDIYPGILLTGDTGSGKSGIATLMKQMIGYSKEARTYGFPAMTPQPLKVVANDNSVLFLEELTNEISRKAEELLRIILNRNSGGTGKVNGNITFGNQSPLFLTGERTLKDRSINNRFVIVGIDKDNWKLSGDKGKEKLKELYTKTAYQDIYNTYVKKQDLFNSVYEKYTGILTKHISSRATDVMAYLFTINEVFELGIPFKTLLEIIEANLKSLGFDNQDINHNPLFKLKNILLRGLLTKQIFLDVVDDFSNDNIECSFIFTNEEYLEKNRYLLRANIEKIVDKYNLDDEKIYLDDSVLIVNMKDTKATDFDKIIYNITLKMKKF